MTAAAISGATAPAANKEVVPPPEPAVENEPIAVPHVKSLIADAEAAKQKSFTSTGELVDQFAVRFRESPPEVIKEVPVEVEKVVEKVVEKEVIKEVPVEVVKYVEREVIKEVPVPAAVTTDSAAETRSVGSGPSPIGIGSSASMTTHAVLHTGCRMPLVGFGAHQP